MSESDASIEIKIVKLQMVSEHQSEAIEDLKGRVAVLEDLHSEQVSILGKLSQTVDILANTVKSLNEVTSEVATSHAVIKARFNWIIAILSGIGTAILVGLIEMLSR